MEYCEKKYEVQKGQVRDIKGYAIFGNRPHEVRVYEGMRIVVLPLKPMQCEKEHKLCSATLYIKDRAIPCYYCRSCRSFYINHNNLLRWSWSPIIKKFFYQNDLLIGLVPESVSRNSDPKWFALYCKYVNGAFGSVEEYFENLNKEQQKKEEEARRERVLITKEWEKQNRIAMMAKAENDDYPLGYFPKRRRRGLFS